MISLEYAKNILVALTGSTSAVTFPATPYLALFTAMPTFEGSSMTNPTEVSSTISGSKTGYARYALSQNGPYGKTIFPTGWSADTSSVGTSAYCSSDASNNKVWIKNQDLIQFPMCVHDNGWSTIVGYGIYNGSTNGASLLYWGTFSQSKTVAKDQIPVIKQGDMEIVFDGSQTDIAPASESSD